MLDGYSTSEGDIKSLALFGEYLCAATAGAVYIYKVNPKEPSDMPEYYTTLRIPKSFGTIRNIIHPQTYLNKLAIVAESTILLYNIRTGRLLFTSEEFDSPITTIECSPVLDVVGVGTASGDVHLYHLRQGRIMFTMNAGERVTAMTFRTDGQPILGVGTAAGNLLFYHLDTKKRIHIIRDAHREAAGGVSNIQFFNGQPIFVTNGGDNFLSEYVFDPTVIYSNTQNSADSVNAAIASPPRLLRSRGGHSLPPTQIHFTDEEAHHMLSVSRDQSLWSFSLRKDAQNHEFSQREKRTDSKGKKKSGLLGSMKDKFPEITSVTYQASKQGRWDNIITSHKDLTYAHTWDAKRGIVGAHRLHTSDGGLVKTVALSGCGNFGLVGSSLGGVAVYNMQSGILRKKFAGHSQSVTGIAVDNLNRVMITTSLDGQVRFYNFKTSALLHRIKLGSSATQMILHTGSDLLAISLDNLSIVVIDIATKKTVRELWGHSNRITTFDFSPDGRWIISAALDSTIRTWDLPTGGCIDVVRVENLVTCLRMSPNSDWLATTHVQGVGISLWTNRSQFKKVATRIITEEDETANGINTIEMPNAAGEGGANIIEGAFDEESDEDGELNNGMSYRTLDRLSDDLITLSLLPRSKFNTLTHLDTIKLRNKAKEAPKKPVKAPFFLSVGNKNENLEIKDTESSGGMQPRVGVTQSSETTFTRLLREFTTSSPDDAAAASKIFITHFKDLSPSATDLEIRSLSTFPPLVEFIGFIDALTFTLERHADFELVQAWMAMLLRVHGDVIMDHARTKVPELGEALGRWEVAQMREAGKLDKLARYCSGVLEFLKTA